LGETAMPTYVFANEGSLLKFKKLEYKIIYYSPNTMLADHKISWETKGYLAFIIFNRLESEIRIPTRVFRDLLNASYLREVQK
jgi:hypothetical protein